MTSEKEKVLKFGCFIKMMITNKRNDMSYICR